jgi:hypothetical protein
MLCLSLDAQHKCYATVDFFIQNKHHKWELCNLFRLFRNTFF